MGEERVFEKSIGRDVIPNKVVVLSLWDWYYPQYHMLQWFRFLGVK